MSAESGQISSGPWYAAFRPELIALLVVLAFGLPTLWQPLGRDHGNCAYVADAVLRGEAPYHDAWETRPPAIFYLNAAAIALFGHTGFALRLFDLIFQAGAALALVRLGRRYFGPLAGAWTGALFAAVYFAPISFWDLANGDIYAVLPTALMLLCLVPERRGSRAAWDFAAGLLIGFVFWVRFTHGLVYLPAIAAIWLDARRHAADSGTQRTAIARFLTRMTALSLGFLAAVGGYLGLLATQGALPDFLYTLFDFDRHYAATTYAGGIGPFVGYALSMHWSWLWRTLAMIVPALFGWVHLMRARRGDEAAIVLSAWAVSAYLGTAIMAKFFTYHFFVMLGPLAILGGYTLSEAIARPPAPWVRRWMRGVLMACGALFLLAPGTQTLARYTRGLALASGRLTPDAYWKTFDREREAGTFSATADYAGARYLRERTTPDDRVFIWSTDTLVLFNANRRAPGRYNTNLMFWPDWRRVDWLDELIGLLETEKPAYAVVTFNDAARNVTGKAIDSKTLLGRLPALADYFSMHYRLETTIGNMEFYRRI